MKSLRAIMVMALGLITVLSLFALACGNTTAAETDKPLRIGVVGFGEDTLDPFIVMDATRFNVTMPMYESLVWLDGAKIVPRVVKAWELSPDGLSWVLHIQQGIKFHNGKDLTAEDVKFSIEGAMSPVARQPEPRNMIKKVDLVDKYTVRVHTNGRQPGLLGFDRGLGMRPIVPKDFDLKNPVGSGPYRLVKFIPGDSVVYEAVKTHWRRVPAFKKLEIINMKEESSRVAAFKTGELDIIEVGLQSARELRKLGYETPQLMTIIPMVQFYGTHDPRFAKTPLADVRVRQALSLGINRKELGMTFFDGLLGPCMPPFLWEGALDLDVPYWRDYSAKIYRYDPEEAKRILANAGYPNGFSMKLYTYVQDRGGFIPDMAPIIQGYWERIGVKAQLAPTDWASFAPKFMANPIASDVGGQSAAGRFQGETNIQLAMRVGYHSSGTYRLFGPAKPELDKLIDDSIHEIDAGKRKKLTAEVIKMTIDQFVSVPLGTFPHTAAVSRRVSVKFNSPTLSIPLYAEEVVPRAK